MVSTGVFTSCKDYDDDISGLEQKYTDLNTDLAKQKESLETALATAKADAAKAQTAADKAQSTADAAKSEAEKAAAEAAAAKELATKAAADAKAEAIVEAKKYVDDLMAKVATAADLTALTEDFSALSGKVDGIQTGLNTLDEALKAQGVTLNEEIKAREKADNALATQIEALKKFEEATGTKFEGVAADLKEIRAELANLGSKEEIEKLLKEANEKVQKEVGDQLNTLMGVLSSHLNSLVFMPNFYYQGIEAMEATTFNYNAYTVKTVNADDEFSADKPTAVTNGATSLTPGLVANYHMNPSTADYKKITSLTYITDDKVYTRANTVVKANVFDFTADKGVLTVHSQLTDGTVKDIEADGKVTVLALQAHYSADGKQDTIITSDYAAVKAVNYKNLVLADARPIADVETRHLYTDAQTAISAAATHEILWNNDKGIDVAELVNTHRDLVDATATHAKWDVNATDGVVKNYGFKYSFELVGYHKGNNKTSESAHAAMKGSVLRPQMTSNGKQQAWGFEQNKATKDREPLLRIILTDTVSNKIATVGYLKFKIVDKTTPTKNEVILSPVFNFKDTYTVDCAQTNIKHSLTWYQVEEQIIAQLEKQGISKAEFHDDFKLDGGEADATQYDGALVDSKIVTTPVGVVAQTTWDPSDEQTEVLTWTVKNNEAYQIFKKNESMTVNVRYSKEVGTGSGVYQYVYVTFTWKPEPRNVKPAGTIADSDKIRNYWYAANQNVAGAGYSDIHANVEPVGQIGATDKFETDILNTFVGNDVTVSGVAAAYKEFVDAKLNKTFTFVVPQGAKLTPVTGASGQKYDITVSTDKLTIYANKDKELAKQAVVLIDGSVLKYQQTDYAKDILNYADHNELKDYETFTTKIQINAANCPEVPFELSNNAFFAKFLRPVTVGDAHETNFLDAETGGSKADLKLTFVDWRDHNFDNVAVTKGENYYKYYKISSIKCLESEIKTDLNAAAGDFAKLLTEVTTKVKFTFTAPTSAEIQDGNGTVNHFFGSLLYENNGATVGEFQIQVPFDITYEWGTIREYVICKIAKTTAN